MTGIALHLHNEAQGVGASGLGYAFFLGAQMGQQDNNSRTTDLETFQYLFSGLCEL